VEQVRGKGRVRDLHVAVLVLALELLDRREDARILVAELEEALETARRVLWTLAVEAVRQRHDETGALDPLLLASSNELINDALRVVGEVTELGLPHDEAIGVGQRVAVFETEGAILAERRVRNDELALVLADVLQRRVGLLGLLVVEHGVTLRESTALDILTGNADMAALNNHRTEGKGLGGGPVDVFALENRLCAVGQDTLQVGMGVEALRSGANDLTNVEESLAIDTGRVVGQDLGGKLLG
jgi:hypothetical protein